MTLTEYLTDRGLSQRDFAGRSGVDEGQLSRYLRGIERPNADNIERIRIATDGLIDSAYWATCGKRNKRKAKRKVA